MLERLSQFSVCLVLCAALGACGAPPPASEETPRSSGVATTGAPLRLPISLNALMVALVNHAADPIWLAAWRTPESDADWRNLERMALQLEVAGALLVVPGTGPMDDAWTADPAWQAWSNRLRDAGVHAVDAVRARDLARVASAGDEIVDVCEGCHIAFKPDLPTEGMFGELSPTASDFEEEAPVPE